LAPPDCRYGEGGLRSSWLGGIVAGARIAHRHNDISQLLRPV
jgi:hypothetical protein